MIDEKITICYDALVYKEDINVVTGLLFAHHPASDTLPAQGNSNTTGP